MWSSKQLRNSDATSSKDAIDHVKNANSVKLYNQCLTDIENAKDEIFNSHKGSIIKIVEEIGGGSEEIVLSLQEIANNSEKVIGDCDAKTIELLEKVSDLIRKSNVIRSIWSAYLTGMNPTKETFEAYENSEIVRMTSILEKVKAKDKEEASLELNILCNEVIALDKATLLNNIVKKINGELSIILHSSSKSIDEQHLSNPESMESTKGTIVAIFNEKILDNVNKVKRILNYSDELVKKVKKVKKEAGIVSSRSEEWLASLGETVFRRAKLTISRTGRVAANMVMVKTIQYANMVGIGFGAIKAAVTESLNLLSLGAYALKELLLEIPTIILNGIRTFFSSIATITNTLIEILEAILPVLLIIILYVLLGLIGVTFISMLWKACYKFVIYKVLPWIALQMSNVFVI